jgi:uncharacterized protein (UPF0212 family)
MFIYFFEEIWDIIIERIFGIMADTIIVGTTLGGALAGMVLTLFGIKKTIKKELKECFGVEAAIMQKDIAKHEEAIQYIKQSKDEYMTEFQCKDRLEGSEKIFNLQFEHHTEQIKKLEVSQEKGFAIAFKKLDKIIFNGGLK